MMIERLKKELKQTGVEFDVISKKTIKLKNGFFISIDSDIMIHNELIMICNATNYWIVEEDIKLIRDCYLIGTVKIK